MQHAVEAVAMMLEQVVGHQRQVVSPGREVFGKAVFLAGAGLGDVEVGDVPVLDHQTEGTGRLEALELPQAFDGEGVRGVEFLLLTGQVFVGLGEVFLVGDGIALACREVEEAEGCTVGATLVAQDLALDDRAPAFSVGPDLQRVSNEPVISGDLQAKLQSDLNGFIRETAARHLAVASSLGQRLGHAHRQGVLEKGEHVEQGGLAGAIGPHQHAQARNVFRLHIAEQPVVLDGDGFDLHGGTFQSNVAGQRMSIRSFTSRWLPEPRSTILLTSTKWSETGWPDTSQATLALVDDGAEVAPLGIAQQMLQVSGQPIFDPAIGLLGMPLEGAGQCVDEFGFHVFSLRLCCSIMASNASCTFWAKSSCICHTSTNSAKAQRPWVPSRFTPGTQWVSMVSFLILASSPR